MKNQLFILVLALLISNYIFAQKTYIQETPKSAVYVTGGTLVLINEISLNYDILLKEKEKGFFKRYYSHFEIGSFKWYKFFNGSSSGVTGSIGFIGLTGKRRKHFEVGLGASLYTELKESDDVERSYVSPNISLGYRYESDDGFIFRTGFAAIKGLYLSFGYSF